MENISLLHCVNDEEEILYEDSSKECSRYHQDPLFSFLIVTKKHPKRHLDGVTAIRTVNHALVGTEELEFTLIC